MLPAMSTTEPNRPTAAREAHGGAEQDAREQVGQARRGGRFVAGARAQRGRPSLHLASSSCATGWTERTTKGKVTTQQRQPGSPHVVATAWMPTGDVGPTRASRMIPTTMVGQREGQSMSALNHRLAAEVVAHEHPRRRRAGHRR